MLAYAKSDIGLIRKTNEDSYIFLPPNLFVVADGMGGHEAGEVASSLAVNTISEYMLKSGGAGDDPGVILSEAVVAANQIIYQFAQAKTECSGMGTTVTAVYIHENTIYWGHVGDSRLYLFRDKVLEQLTKDHSLVGELLQSGSITPEQAHTHPHRNILTRAVGTGETVQVDCGNFTWGPGDQLLLCTDGLTSMMSDQEIRELLASGDEITTVVDTMIGNANAAGGLDNITTILLHYGE
jgi:protein phosphatase